MVPPRWRRPQPLIARSRFNFSPAHVVYGLCGFLGGFCLCCGRPYFRPLRPRLGALGKAVDNGCMGIFIGWYCAWLLVGVLRIRLGWLVVLGPSRKCFLYALANRNSAHPLPRRNGKAQSFPRLDSAACYLNVFS